MTALGDILRERLDEKGWSARELSRRADLPQATVHKILTGQALQPRPDTLEALADALGMSPKYLLKAAAEDAGYVAQESNQDGIGLLIAGIRELPEEKQREIAALVEAMLLTNSGKR